MKKLLNKIINSSFINQISFLWHWKNFFFCLKYPFWKSRNVWTGKFMGYSYTWYLSIPNGWRIAFGKQLSDDIKTAGKQTRKRLHKYISWKKLLKWEQIKEKYGELCLYATASEEIQEVLDRYELLSQGYCINCGKPARYITRDWIEFYCEDCFSDYLDTLKENVRVELLNSCRLKVKDIPKLTAYKNGKSHKIDIKEKYGIDFRELWDIKRGGK